MNCVAITKGIQFIIEWYVNQHGISQAYEFFNKSSAKQQDKVLALFF